MGAMGRARAPLTPRSSNRSVCRRLGTPMLLGAITVGSVDGGWEVGDVLDLPEVLRVPGATSNRGVGGAAVGGAGTRLGACVGARASSVGVDSGDGGRAGRVPVASGAPGSTGRVPVASGACGSDSRVAGSSGTMVGEGEEQACEDGATAMPVMSSSSEPVRSLGPAGPSILRRISSAPSSVSKTRRAVRSESEPSCDVSSGSQA
jgi:hypothetical protein